MVKQVLRNKDILKKLLFTAFIIVVFRVGTTIPVPGIDTNIIKSMVEGNGLLSLYNLFTGGAFSNFTLFALGIGPFITASIIIQLLTIGFETLKELQKSGEEGRKAIEKYTRYTALVLAIVQATGITLGIIRNALKSDNPYFIATVVMTLVAASMIVMWLADKITEKGIGNGSSVLIFVGIVSRIPIDGTAILNQIKSGNTKNWEAVLLLFIILVTIVAVTFIQEAVRKIPVQYAKRLSGRTICGIEESHIPMKVNQSGVMPIIFASSILALPQTIALFMNKNVQDFVGKWLSTASPEGFWIYRILEIILIVFFSYFYTTISFNVEDIVKNLKNSGSFIPGIRPGHATEKYLNDVLSKLTIVGAVFLGVIAMIPALITHYLGLPMSLAGTSLLIVVGVALELKKQLESQLVMKDYHGFLE